MKKCIYTLLTDTKFDNPEHIVPAFLGGSEVFKNNVVSDIANKYFSKLEDRLAHKSVLSMLRDTYGPGKRGAKEFKSRPLIANYSQGKSLFVSTSGTNVTFLEQVILFFNLKGYALSYISSANDEKKSINDLAKVFVEKIRNINDDDRYEFIENPLSQPNRWIITYSNKRWYISSKQHVDVKILRNIILYGKFNPKLIEILEVPHNEELNIAKVALDNIEIKQALSKILFNVFADVYGLHEAIKPKFDDIRNFSYKGINSDRLLFNYEGIIDLNKLYLDLNIDISSHLFIFFKEKNNILGYSSYYGSGYTFGINLGYDDSIEYNGIQCYYCDWKNKNQKSHFIKEEYRSKYIYPHSIPKHEILNDEKVLDIELNSINKQLAYSLIKDENIPDIYIKFDSKNNKDYVQITKFLNSEDMSIDINAFLPVAQFNSALTQALNYVKYFHIKYRICQPKSRENPGEKYISNLINILSSFTILDLNHNSLQYDPEFMYTKRFNDMISNYLRFESLNLSDDYTESRLILESVILSIYNEKVLDDIIYLFGISSTKMLNSIKQLIGLVHEHAKQFPKNYNRTKLIDAILDLLDLRDHLFVDF